MSEKMPEKPDNPMNLTEDQEEQFRILLIALEIYLQRDKIRGDLWRTRPLSHKLEMIAEKHDRVMAGLDKLSQIEQGQDDLAIEIIKAMVDDLLDIVNFAVFGVRLIKEKQLG
jgi:hypothetical protein